MIPLVTFDAFRDRPSHVFIFQENWNCSPSESFQSFKRPPRPPSGFSVTTGYPFFFQKSSDPPLKPSPPRPLGLPQTTNHYRTEDTIVLKYN